MHEYRSKSCGEIGETFGYFCLFTNGEIALYYNYLNVYSICMETQDFESRLAVLKQRQFDLLQTPCQPDALSMPLRGIKIAVHQVLCDMARSDLRETGRISGRTRTLVEKNRARLIDFGVEAIAVEMEAAVLREYGPEQE